MMMLGWALQDHELTDAQKTAMRLADKPPGVVAGPKRYFGELVDYRRWLDSGGAPIPRRGEWMT